MLYWVITLILLLTSLLWWLLGIRKSHPFHQVQLMMKDGQYEAAIAKLTLLAENIDLATEAYLYLAECHEAQANKAGAREFYSKALHTGGFEDVEKEIELYRKICHIANEMGDIEGCFENSLEILRLNPMDEEANTMIGLLALGDEQFQIAIRYLEPVYQLSDENNASLAFAVARWQVGEREEALHIITNLMEKNPNDLNIKLLFATMANFGSYLSHGKKATLELIKEITDDTLRILLFNVYLSQCAQAKSFREALDFLKTHVQADTLPRSRSKDLKYVLLLLLLNEEMFLEASRLFREIYDQDSEYKEIKLLKVFIDEIDLNPHAENLKPFKQILKENFESLIKPDLSFSISGFRKNRGIAFNKFFDMRENPPQLRIEYDVMTAEKSENILMSMTNEEFSNFVFYLIKVLEYNEPVKESSGEKDLVLYSAISSKNKSIRSLFAFYRLKNESHISDISLRNLQNKMQTLKADRTYIISSGELTEGAIKLIKDEPSLKKYDADHIAEWLHDYYKSRK